VRPGLARRLDWLVSPRNVDSPSLGARPPFNPNRIVTSGDQLLLAFEIAREVTPSLRLVSMDINKDGVVSSGDQLLQVQFLINAGSCP